MITERAVIIFICSFLVSSVFLWIKNRKERTREQNVLVLKFDLYILFAIAIGLAFRWFLFELLNVPSFLEPIALFGFGIAITYPLFHTFDN